MVDADLLTPRLRLRRFESGDVERLLELDSDPAVMRYLTGGRATSRAELERDYLPAFLRLRRAMWGHGYATEGARTLVDCACFDGGARRVYAMSEHRATKE